MHPDDLNDLFLLRRYIMHRLDEMFNYGDLSRIEKLVDDSIAYIEEYYKVIMPSSETIKNYPLKRKHDKIYACHLIFEYIEREVPDDVLLSIMAYLYQVGQWLKFDITYAINHPNTPDKEETEMVANSIKSEQGKKLVQNILEKQAETANLRNSVSQESEKTEVKEFNQIVNHIYYSKD